MSLMCKRCTRNIEHLGPGSMWCGNCGWRNFAQVAPALEPEPKPRSYTSRVMEGTHKKRNGDVHDS